MTLASLIPLASEAAGGEEQGLFASIAHSWVEGGWGMYPIAFFMVIGLAITVERTIRRLDSQSDGARGPVMVGELDSKFTARIEAEDTGADNVDFHRFLQWVARAAEPRRAAAPRE
jgi:hypothetical protein